MSEGRRTVFVTGGAGFIGSAVVRHLLDTTDAFVVNVDKLTYASNPGSVSQGSPDRYLLAKIDICDGQALRQLFERFRPQTIMHLAAESHVDRSIDGPQDFIQTNVIGTFTLLQEALRHFRNLTSEQQAKFRFLHVSTDEVFGTLGAEGLFTEATAYAPSSPYSASKAASDHLVRAWGATYGLPAIITNCSNNYGPYHFPEKLIPHIVIKALAEEKLPVYGDGRNIRDWLYVEDHARALCMIEERGRVGETYNVGGRNERTNIYVVEKICQILDRYKSSERGSYKRLITFVPDRPGHDRRYAIDASKLERDLGWRAIETFETGLEKTVRWYLENSQWWQGILSRGYSAGRIGLGETGEQPVSKMRG